MKNQLHELLISHFSVDIDEIPPSTYLRDLPDWDSMSHMTFIMKLEDTLSIQLSGDEIVAMQTVGDVLKLIEYYSK